MAWTEDQYSAFMSDRGKAAQTAQAATTNKTSKYRNVKVEIDGEKFDSKREAAYWQELKLREKAGEITGLERQLPFALYAPALGDPGTNVEVASYIADFQYFDHATGATHVVDIKGGKETAMFALKRKWLFLQSGIEIEIIR